MKRETLAHKIIDCAMKVHSALGNGFPEIIYQRALAIELRKQEINFTKEREMFIHYEGIPIGRRKVDFFVEGIIMVELKTLGKLGTIHLAHAINNCRAYSHPIGLLLNFGSKSLEFKRVYDTSYLDNKEYLLQYADCKGLKCYNRG